MVLVPYSTLTWINAVKGLLIAGGAGESVGDKSERIKLFCFTNSLVFGNVFVLYLAAKSTTYVSAHMAYVAFDVRRFAQRRRYGRYPQNNL